MAATAERLKQLDAKATAEAAAVADLHDQHKAVQQKLQVRLPSSNSIHRSRKTWSARHGRAYVITCANCKNH